MVLSWTGLVSGGEMGSSSLLFGAEAVLSELERLPTGWVLALPDWALDAALVVDGRPTPGLAEIVSRPLGVRVGAPVFFEPEPAALGAVADETCRACLAGMGGGAMDGRAAETDERDREVGFALDGVVVRDGTPLEGAVPSCLVGDLVGD
jgi:hypothetical protein